MFWTVYQFSYYSIIARRINAWIFVRVHFLLLLTMPRCAIFNRLSDSLNSLKLFLLIRSLGTCTCKYMLIIPIRFIVCVTSKQHFVGKKIQVWPRLTSIFISCNNYFCSTQFIIMPFTFFPILFRVIFSYSFIFITFY